MVVTQDKPLAAVFRQVEVGRFLQLWKRLNGARRSFSGDPAERLFLIKGAVKLSRFMRLGKKLPWRCCEKIASLAFCRC